VSGSWGPTSRVTGGARPDSRKLQRGARFIVLLPGFSRQSADVQTANWSSPQHPEACAIYEALPNVKYLCVIVLLFVDILRYTSSDLSGG
jgi:hypothetical protein